MLKSQKLHLLLWATTLIGLSYVPAAAIAADEAKSADVAIDDPAKFFLFHGEGLGKDQVRGDLVYCIGQAYPILSMRDKMGSSGGLLGAIINSHMAGIDRLRMRNAAMRKCMGMMGYARYQVPEEIWKPLVRNGDIVIGDNGRIDPEVVERMVDFATGAVPPTERLPL